MAIPGVSVTAGSGTELRMRPIYDGSGATAYAQNVDTAPMVETPVGAGGTAYLITAATAFSVGTATHAFVSVESAPNVGVRWWNTGATPSSTLGHFLAPGWPPLEITNASLLQFASASTTGATIQLSLHAYS